MSSKSLLRVLVGGPFQNAISPDGVFNSKIRQLIETVLRTIKKANYLILSAHIYENFGEMDVSNKYQEVCARDYEWMKECDLFIAILPLDSEGEVIHSSGTTVELGWASAIGKPIVLVRDPAPKYSHLVAGLSVVTQVTEVYINEKDFEVALCHAVDRCLNKN